MTVKTLQQQLQFAIENKHITEDDELILIGTGNKTSGFFWGGFCLPKVTVDIDKNVKSGYYGIGVLSQEYNNDPTATISIIE